MKLLEHLARRFGPVPVMIYSAQVRQAQERIVIPVLTGTDDGICGNDER